MTALPPDRSSLATEARRASTRHLHLASVSECVSAINDADAEVAAAVRRAESALVALLEAMVPRFRRGGRVIYLGAGTSGRLGVLDASEAPPTFQVDQGRIVGIIAGGDGSLRTSSEGREDEPDGTVDELVRLSLTKDDTVIGIAAGGTTPYVIGAFPIARRLAPGCLTALLSCSPVASPRACDHIVVADTGPEVITGSTRMKAGTATKMMLNTISTTLMIQDGRVYENLMVALRATNDKLKDRAARVVSELTSLSREDSFGLLDWAGGDVRVALVMHMHSVERADAERLLKAAGGSLQAVHSRG